jgi:MATE family, multidrug efflux pump
MNPAENKNANSVRDRSEMRNVIAMSIPVVITTSSRAVMDIADYMMIARLPTTDAQAAILPAQILMWSYIVVGIGVVSMVSTYASQCLGRKEYKECSAYAWQSLYIGVIFGALAAALAPLSHHLVAVVGHDPAVQRAEISYLQIALLTAGPTIAAGGLGWFFIGIHKPWVTMWSAIEANVVNIIISYVLIFGYLGFEPMGIRGAAWGTLAAVSYRTVRLALTLLIPSIDRQFASRDTWKPSWPRIKKLLRFGIPFGLQWTSEVVVWAVFVNILIGRNFGTTALLATNSTWQYMRISFLPSMGVGQALTALVGKSIGSGDHDRATREVRMAAWITATYMGGLSIIYGFFGPELVGFFNADPEVMRIGGSIMICAAVFQLFDALGITYSSALRGAGDTFVPAIFFIVSTWLIIVGGGWYMATYHRELGSLGPWLAGSTLIIVTAIFLWWRWHSGAWRKIDIFAAKKIA